MKRRCDPVVRDNEGGVSVMGDGLKIKMYSYVLDCRNPQELGRFYAALLQWEIGFNDDEYAWAYAPGSQRGTYPFLLFQQDLDYVPPVWPEEPEAQQQMAHIDFIVSNLEQAVQHAIRCGASVANAQGSESWRVMIDPAGHPFCLCEINDVLDSADFALL
jgi:catechol 2,3-dioxygenase-like lactoylglutathione lyase family enzyme